MTRSWFAKRHSSESATPLSREKREDNYRRQNRSEKLTPRQERQVRRQERRGGGT